MTKNQQDWLDYEEGQAICEFIVECPILLSVTCGVTLLCCLVFMSKHGISLTCCSIEDRAPGSSFPRIVTMETPLGADSFEGFRVTGAYGWVDVGSWCYCFDPSHSLLVKGCGEGGEFIMFYDDGIVTFLDSKYNTFGQLVAYEEVGVHV